MQQFSPIRFLKIHFFREGVDFFIFPEVLQDDTGNHGFVTNSLEDVYHLNKEGMSCGFIFSRRSQVSSVHI